MEIDILWILICAVLVFLMQAGFLCYEAGLTRQKNSINVALKNISDFVICSLVWWLIGFGLMFGVSSEALFSSATEGASHRLDFFMPDFRDADMFVGAFYVFQMMFCATVATIVSGAIAERTKFLAYKVMTLITVVLIYPVVGNWTWGAALGVESAWLANRGFVDFAGSTVVHAVGGWVALAAIFVIGPRLGRFDESANQHDARINASNLSFAMVGVLIISIGWMGFNGGSTLALSSAVPFIIINTILAAAAGSISAFFVSKIWRNTMLESAGQRRPQGRIPDHQWCSAVR